MDKINTDYIKYLELNGTINKDGNIETPTYIADIAHKNKQNGQDSCSKLYK